MDAVAVARGYYAAIDAGAYDDLAALLAPGFVHERPDRTIEGRDRFVEFVREGRPRTDTRHEVAEIYPGDETVAVRGRLLDAAGATLFGFVDVFAIEDGRIVRLRTFTNGRVGADHPSAGDER